jgi:3-dehydroquinate synthase
MESERVPVSLGDRSYDIMIGERLLDQMMHFAEGLKPSSIFIITDSNVGPLHAEAVRNAVVANYILTVPAGEGSKSVRTLERLFDQVFKTGRLDRQSLIVALGGGVVGDLAGFAAATLLRGVRCMQVPTSLLAMIDSSVGGKTAINHKTGKNLIGAFHQPAAVFCDLHFLNTLPDREYVSALAEAVKTAAIGDANLLAYLENNATALLQRDRFKAGVVSDDELEAGRRATLNFGHTLAHVIETVYPGRYLHGEAVAIGMRAALGLSVERAKLNAESAARVLALLQRLGLPTDVPGDLQPARMLEVMASDKKRAGESVRFVVLGDIGQAGALPCRLDARLAGVLLGRE